MNAKLKIGVLLLILTWLFIGIKQDDEFGDHDLFLKYRPNTQIYFKSPLGMQDMPASYAQQLKVEEQVYDEFITERHWSDHVGLSTSVCGVLILGTLSFLILGLIKLFKPE